MQKVRFPNNRPQLDLGDIEKKKNTLEYKTVLFTVVLYFFVCFGLLTIHYMGPYLPKAPAILEQEAEEAAERATSGKSKPDAGDNARGRQIESSSGSPHNPHLYKKKATHSDTGKSNTEESNAKEREE